MFLVSSTLTERDLAVAKTTIGEFYFTTLGWRIRIWPIAIVTQPTKLLLKSLPLPEHLTDGWNGGDDLSELELVQDGRFTGGVESDHQDSHLLLAEEAFEEGGEHVTHRGSVERLRVLVKNYKSVRPGRSLGESQVGLDSWKTRIRIELYGAIIVP